MSPHPGAGTRAAAGELLARPRGAPAAPRSGSRLEPAGPADDEALRGLLRDAPVGGAIRLSLECEPSWFAAAAVEGDRHDVLVLRDPAGGIAGMGSRSVGEAWVDGAPARLGYLGQLRLAPGRRIGRRALAEGYRRLLARRREDELPFDLTSIVADNVPARRLLERGLPELPVYTRLAAGLVTLVLPTCVSRSVARRDAPGVWDGGAGDLHGIAARLEREGRSCKIATRWTPSRLAGLASGRLGRWCPLVLADAGGVRGCAAVWDQRALRQVVVRGYAPLLARARPALNAALRALHRPRLPAPGTPLRLGYLSHLAADTPEDACRLVAAGRERAVRLGLDLLALGLAEDDPLLGAIRRRHGGRAYRSILYLVHDGPLDPARLPLDPGPIRVEAAVL